MIDYFISTVKQQEIVKIFFDNAHGKGCFCGTIIKYINIIILVAL